MRLEFVFGLPADNKGNSKISVFVLRLSKIFHLTSVRDNVTGTQAAQLLFDRFALTGSLWGTLSRLLGTKLTMSIADHPQTDGQTELVNCVLDDTIWSICAGPPRPCQQYGARINGVYPVLLERVMAPSNSANLVGRHRCLHG
ncbi:Pol protein [Phytophthora palmivora]|uniref:Pol protein n=1 Tax=Phytophthora palmivora TaxID=4796 RepID=A0A2P4XJV9_9STRA|nr:Pol protein [Phytophthora palmivora]